MSVAAMKSQTLSSRGVIVKSSGGVGCREVAEVASAAGDGACRGNLTSDDILAVDSPVSAAFRAGSFFVAGSGRAAMLSSDGRWTRAERGGANGCSLDFPWMTASLS